MERTDVGKHTFTHWQDTQKKKINDEWKSWKEEDRGIKIIEDEKKKENKFSNKHEEEHQSASNSWREDMEKKTYLNILNIIAKQWHNLYVLYISISEGKWLCFNTV